MPLPMYANLLQQLPAHHLSQGEIAEPGSRYLMLTERHIQAMWLEQKYFKSLKTHEGQEIAVISPGIWNSGAGPDFLKAHLRIGKKEMRGDIELHLADEGWYQHKHHTDSNYNTVILHISYWTPNHARPLLTAESSNIPRAYFDTALTIPEARILNLIDLDLYPYTHFAGTGVCASTLFRTLPEHDITSFFRSAAQWRLGQKSASLKAKADHLDVSVTLGIAMVLGYKNNTEAFAQLFSTINSQKFESEKECFACALGQCGFFETQYQLKWKSSPYYQELYTLYTSFQQPKNLPQIHLKQNKIRPPSHPVRRLAALAKILTDKGLESLVFKLLEMWYAHWQTLDNKKNLHAFRKLLISLLPTYQDDYWQHHYAFENKAQAKSIVLIGDDLKREMIINVFLPILYERIQENPKELEVFKSLYASFPSPQTHKATYLVHRFFGNAPTGKVLKKIDIQQGAYQLHKDFCIHFEASCQGCPFVGMYKTTFQNKRAC